MPRKGHSEEQIIPTILATRNTSKTWHTVGRSTPTIISTGNVRKLLFST